MNSDLHAAHERVMDRQSDLPTKPREKSRGFPVIQIVIGVLWGTVFMIFGAFTNVNYDRMQAAVARGESDGLLFRGLVAFILGTLVLIAFGILRRLVFAGFRQRRGWSLIISFLVGTACGSLALRFAAGGAV